MLKQENLEEIMERKINETRARFFYPATPRPKLTKETPNGSADIVSLEIQVNPDYIKMLKENGIQEEDSLDETLSHEYTHITKFPGTAANRMHQYLIARKLLESKDLAESAVYSFNEVQTNIFNGVDLKNKATPKIQKILAKDSRGLNKILNGLYQEIFKEDLGIKFNWRNKKEKNLIKKLKEIQFTDQNNENQNLEKFVFAVKDNLKDYKSETKADFLGMFNEEQIQGGLASLAQECMNNGYSPNQFEQLSLELLNDGKIYPGAGSNKSNLSISRNIYIDLAKNYAIPIVKTKTAKNGSLIPHEQKPFSIQRQLKMRQRPLVVVDWGCGTGRAISSLAIKFKENVHAFGFSKDSYKEWEEVREAKLIHAPEEDFFRYFKDESIDALYSHLGLVHLAPLGFDADYGLMAKAIDYIARVFRKISRGGVMAFDAPTSGFFMEDLEKRLKTSQMPQSNLIFRL